MPFTPWHRQAVWDVCASRDHPRGPSLRTSRSAFRLTDPTMSKGGAKARHSVRNWRFCVPARGTRASNRDPRAPLNITNLLGKLPRNVSDHENLPCFQGEIVCTLVRRLTRGRDRGCRRGGPVRRGRSAQFPDTARRETDHPSTRADLAREPLLATPVAPPGGAGEGRRRCRLPPARRLGPTPGSSGQPWTGSRQAPEGRFEQSQRQSQRRPGSAAGNRPGQPVRR